MAGREELHDLRKQAHEAGIQGNSKMTENELRQALKKVGKKTDPVQAKREVKG